MTTSVLDEALAGILEGEGDESLLQVENSFTDRVEISFDFFSCIYSLPILVRCAGLQKGWD